MPVRLSAPAILAVLIILLSGCQNEQAGTNHKRIPDNKPANSSPAKNNVELNDYLCIAGEFNGQNELNLNFIMPLDYPLFDLPEKQKHYNDEKPYILQTLNKDSTLNSQYNFGALEMSIIKEEGGQEINSRSFNFSVPYGENIKKIIIKKAGRIIHEISRTPNAPAVFFTKPENNQKITGAEINISWKGSDKDEDRIFYRLESSSDGGKNWQPETSLVEITSISKETKYFNAKKSLLLRIISTDGLNSSADKIEVITD